MSQMVISENRFEISGRIFNKWLSIRQQNRTLGVFFQDNYIKSVAIYGIGALGERFIDELNGVGINIEYGIDRRGDSRIVKGVRIRKIDESTDLGIDAIIVTPVQDYWSIVETLEEYVSCPILSLEDIVDYCME